MTRTFSIEWVATPLPNVKISEVGDGTFNYSCRIPYRLASKEATENHNLFGASAERIIEAAESDLERHPEEFEKVLSKLQIAALA